MKHITSELKLGQSSWYFFHLDAPVVESLCELLKVLSHSEGDGVVPEDAAGFNGTLFPLLLNHFLHLQLQGNLTHVRANTCRDIA